MTYVMDQVVFKLALAFPSEQKKKIHDINSLLFIYEMFELKVWHYLNVCFIRWPVFAIFELSKQ